MSDNRFDDRAATWDEDPAHVERARIVAEVIRATLRLGPDVRMLDYGAGTGLLSEALRDDVGPITLADTSAGMRDVIAGKIARGSLAGAALWSTDLSGGTAGPDAGFDLVATVLTLHHVPDVAPVLANFGSLLADDGHLAVVDLDREDGSFHADGFDGHHGFDHGALTDELVRAGFVDIEFRPCHAVVRDGRTYPMFLATGRRSRRGS